MQMISAEKIFTGKEWLTDHIIVIKENKVEQVVPKSEAPSGEVKAFPSGCFIVPAFIDVQVYGAAKKLLAVYPEPGTLQAMYDEFI